MKKLILASIVLFGCCCVIPSSASAQSSKANKNACPDEGCFWDCCGPTRCGYVLMQYVGWNSGPGNCSHVCLEAYCDFRGANGEDCNSPNAPVTLNFADPQGRVVVRMTGLKRKNAPKVEKRLLAMSQHVDAQQLMKNIQAKFGKKYQVAFIPPEIHNRIQRAKLQPIDVVNTPIGGTR